MGTIIQAACSCGFKSRDLFYGVGFNTLHSKSSNEVSYCDHCGTVELSEVTDKGQPVCSQCGARSRFYIEALNDPGPKTWSPLAGDILIEEGHKLYCPRCREQRLQLREMGCWD